jgi:uncharacterized protein YodC (DUF2158 family)
MSLRQRGINASDLELVGAAESFNDPREPALRMGCLVKLNSGGPAMMVVDLEGPAAVVAWVDHSGVVCERRFPVACVHRVSPASEGSAGPAF